MSHPVEPQSSVTEDQEATVRAAIVVASEKWKDAINSGNAAAAAAVYEAGATMVAAPFGTFEGRDAIEGFWADLVAKGFGEVEYLNSKIEVIDGQSAILSSDWRMNLAAGHISRELWVLQPNGEALLREDHFEATSYPGSV